MRDRVVTLIYRVARDALPYVKKLRVLNATHGKGKGHRCRWWHNRQCHSSTRCHRLNRSTTHSCGSRCTSTCTPFYSGKHPGKLGCGDLLANLFTVVVQCNVHCPLRSTLTSRTGSRISASTWGSQNRSRYRNYGCISTGSS